MAVDKPRRRNGYYYKDGIYYPGVTTCMASVGNPEYLIQWAVKCGARALITEVLKDPSLVTHTMTSQTKMIRGKEAEVKNSTSIITTAEEFAIAGYNGEKKRTADFGTTVHNAMEAYLLKQPYKFQDYQHREETAFNQFTSFFDHVGPESLYVESEVFNTVDNYAGRLDWCARIEDTSTLKPWLKRSVKKAPVVGNYIIDLKTGAFNKEKHAIQLAAYARALKETFDVDIDGGMVIHIYREKPEKLSIHTYTGEELDKAYEDFIVCAEAFWRMIAPKSMVNQFNKGE